MQKAAKQHSLSPPEHYLIAVDRDVFRHPTRLWRFVTQQRPAALMFCDVHRVVIRRRLGLKERPHTSFPQWG
jgi:hypothetical protein